ncbi:hypothetical protein PVK06_025051 [Gossypium arboreum]|uniref:Uncharacterized protein n=1 Tax=Gossypium arboreum TaxID=29729 RepID=A0ABR0PFR5_GOSAR|nr:hypothetical protein PVK06_025051 [Gossypium arboreum]
MNNDNSNNNKCSGFGLGSGEPSPCRPLLRPPYTVAGNRPRKSGRCWQKSVVEQRGAHAGVGGGAEGSTCCG